MEFPKEVYVHVEPDGENEYLSIDGELIDAARGCDMKDNPGMRVAVYKLDRIVALEHKEAAIEHPL